MIRTILSALIFISFSCQNRDYGNDYCSCLEKRDYKSAFEIINKQLEIYPDSLEYRFEYFWALSKIKDSGIRKEISEYLLNDSINYLPLVCLRAIQKIGNSEAFEKTIVDFENVISEVQDYKFYAILGDLHFAKDDFEKSIFYYNKASEMIDEKHIRYGSVLNKLQLCYFIIDDLNSSDKLANRLVNEYDYTNEQIKINRDQKLIVGESLKRKDFERIFDILVCESTEWKI